MPYITENQVKRIKLPSNQEYWVELSTSELTWKETKQFSATDEKGSPTAALDMLLVSLIKDWNLDDNNGTKLEINQENIDSLKKRDAEALVNEITGIMAQEQDIEKKTSSKQLPPPSTEEATPQPS